MNFCHREKNKGFTLIEILVGAIIFSIIIVAIFGVFASSIRLQRHTLISQQIINQTSYIMEYMSRFLRMAKKDDGDCLEGNYEVEPGSITFKNYHEECQRFYKQNNRVYQEIDGESFPLTSEKLNVKSLNFILLGDSPMNQPKVTIFLEIEGKGISPAPKIKIQTTVSQRDLNR